MSINQSDQGRQGQNSGNKQNENSQYGEDQNLTGEELRSTGNTFLGDFGKESANNNQAHQGSWAGSGAGYGDTDASAQGGVMPNQSDSGEGDRQSAVGDIPGENFGSETGSGLSTGGDVQSMFGQNIDDLNLPDANDVAESRQDGGTLGQDAADKEVVDTGENNSFSANSGEATTGRADTQGGFNQYPTSGDLGQVDPGQQNYVEDQDSRQAFTAGDYKTSQEGDPEEGSDKYNVQKTNAENVGGTSQDDLKGDG